MNSNATHKEHTMKTTFRRPTYNAEFETRENAFFAEEEKAKKAAKAIFAKAMRTATNTRITKQIALEKEWEAKK